jgi:TonB family protein
MVFPAALERSHQSGVATVRFSVGRDGRPADVAIVESSGYPTIDRAALRTIATLDLPADAPVGPHVAVLQYGSEATLADLSDQPARLDAAEGRARLARDLAERERLVRAGGAAPIERFRLHAERRRMKVSSAARGRSPTSSTPRRGERRTSAAPCPTRSPAGCARG